jgi:hypothetical protein
MNETNEGEKQMMSDFGFLPEKNLGTLHASGSLPWQKYTVSQSIPKK